jgi:hypothetical protein
VDHQELLDALLLRSLARKIGARAGGFVLWGFSGASYWGFWGGARCPPPGGTGALPMGGSYMPSPRGGICALPVVWALVPGSPIGRDEQDEPAGGLGAVDTLAILALDEATLLEV